MPVPPTEHPTAEPQTLDEIRQWHDGIVDALIGQRASVLHAIHTGSGIAPRFVGMTEADVDVYFDAQREELERLTMLNLVASAEASIRADYAQRVRDKGSSTLSRAYQAWHKTLSFKKQLRPDFDEGGILDVLKDAGVVDNHLVGRFRECLRLRHWVGHGRYWKIPVGVDQLDPDEVAARAGALLGALPK